MACACRAGARAGGRNSRGSVIAGYQYTSHTGDVTKFMTFVEARTDGRLRGDRRHDNRLARLLRHSVVKLVYPVIHGVDG